jgi:DNA (cytosine-5)-methyltransferase 1
MNSFDIARARKSLSLTQKQSADIVQVTEKTWQQWESDKRTMRSAYWELFCLKTGYKSINDNKKGFAEYTTKQLKLMATELADETHAKELEEAKNKKYKFIDLFAGIGGIRTAFSTTVSACVFSSDIDPFARHTYYANYGVLPYGDICTLDKEKIPNHDILCGGFPCQPFSHIGKREGFRHPTQGTMFDEILKIVDLKKPRVVFLENVPGLVNHDEGRTLKIVLEELEKRSYSCQHIILNSKDFGVPQMRKRFYLVCFLGNVDFEFPEPPMEYVDIGDFVEDGVYGYSISKHLQKSYLYKVDDGRPKVIDKSSKGQIKTLVSTYHKIQRLTGTFVADGETGLRLLTANECKAIMGFPKDFIFPISRTQMYRQMGNSVVIRVVEEIAKNIYSALERSECISKAKQLASSHRN